jgi:multiple sugar transport system ATP-binding protein
LTDVLDERPFRLSGGQRQRVAMGRAMIREPQLLLMDEPMSNVDAKLRTELRAEIALMQRRLEVTTLYVTHDQVEAMSLGHRAAVMRDGRVVQCDSPQELYRSPCDVFVARFVGTPPMNVLLGEVAGGESPPSLRVGSHTIDLSDAVERWPSLADLVGRQVGVGIRPAAFTVDPSGSVRVEITHVEHVGADQMAYASIDAPSVRQSVEGVIVDEMPVSTIAASIIGPAKVDIWRPTRLRVDPIQIHLFDLETGAAVPTADAVV